MRHSPALRRLYFPKMEASQALLLKTREPETDGHAVFEVPGSPPDPPVRERIEMRTMAFF